jgi:hypothetical protein
MMIHQCHISIGYPQRPKSLKRNGVKTSEDCKRENATMQKVGFAEGTPKKIA